MASPTATTRHHTCLPLSSSCVFLSTASKATGRESFIAANAAVRSRAYATLLKVRVTKCNAEKRAFFYVTTLPALQGSHSEDGSYIQHGTWGEVRHCRCPGCGSTGGGGGSY